MIHFIFQCTTTFSIWIKKKNKTRISTLWFVDDISGFLNVIKERSDLLYLCRVFWGCPRIQGSGRPPRRDSAQIKNPAKENLKRKIFASFQALSSDLSFYINCSQTRVHFDCGHRLLLRLLLLFTDVLSKAALQCPLSLLSALRFVCLCNLIKTASWNTLGEWGLEWSAPHLRQVTCRPVLQCASPQSQRGDVTRNTTCIKLFLKINTIKGISIEILWVCKTCMYVENISSNDSEVEWVSRRFEDNKNMKDKTASPDRTWMNSANRMLQIGSALLCFCYIIYIIIWNMKDRWIYPPYQ